MRCRWQSRRFECDELSKLIVGLWRFWSKGFSRPTYGDFAIVQLKALDEQEQRQVFTIAPCDILPYMAGHVTDVEKALFLRRFGVPFWALTYVFGRNDSYWYNLTTSLGRHDIVGTTVKQVSPYHNIYWRMKNMLAFKGTKHILPQLLPMIVC